MDELVKVSDGNTCLFHGITLAESDCIVLKSLVVDSDAVRSTDCILTAVTLADCIFLFIVCCEVELKLIDNLACFFRKTVFTDKRQHGAFHRCERCREVKHYAGVASGKLFFLVRGAEHAQEHTVNTD